MNPIASSGHFREQFRAGLASLLSHPDLTAAQVVLVCANAILLRDEAIFRSAKAKAAQFVQPNDSEEDQAILRFILDAANPFDLVHRRTTANGWIIQLNDLRALRPKRAAGAPATTIHRPFDPTKFNFTQVPQEAFWAGSWQGIELSCFFNKYPFEAYHALLVPEPAAGREQFLMPQHHQLAWDVCQTLSQHEPGAVVAYNALGAYASVNHLHFQLSLGGRDLPILRPNRLERYPLAVQQHRSAASAWQAIQGLQASNQPFELIYTQGQVLLIPRRFQGAYPAPAWTGGFAWYELSGAIITADSAAYHSLTDDQIETALRQCQTPSPA